MNRQKSSLVERGCAAILLVVGGLKLLGAIAGDGVDIRDVVFGVSWNTMYWIVGILEIACGILIWCCVRPTIRAVFVFLIGTCMVIYRLHIDTNFAEAQACPCLGILEGRLPIPVGAVATGLSIIAMWIWLAGLSLVAGVMQTQ